MVAARSVDVTVGEFLRFGGAYTIDLDFKIESDAGQRVVGFHREVL